jgi:hypothetical protein
MFENKNKKKKSVVKEHRLYFSSTYDYGKTYTCMILAQVTILSTHRAAQRVHISRMGVALSIE